MIRKFFGIIALSVFIVTPGYGAGVGPEDVQGGGP